MSRLERYRQKQMTTRLVVTFLILVAVVVFIFTTGIKLLLSGSAFIARITEKKTSSANLGKNDNFYGGVDIDDIPTATNSARFFIGGSVTNFSELEFYINDEKVKKTSLTASDNFHEEIGDLTPGANEVYVLAKSEDGNQKKKSKVLTVTYRNEKPKLEISEPQDGLKTNKQEVGIAGKTDREIYIRINDLPIVVDAQGNFQTSIRLKDGENKIIITAEDGAGNIESKTFTVTYQKED